MSTVGYGDIYPNSGMLARLIGAVFILFGTVLLVRFIDVLMRYWAWNVNMKKKKRCLGKLLTSSSEFFEFDENQDGTVCRYEFLVGMLLKLDLVQKERIEEIMAIFEDTDRNGDGAVDRDELKLKIKEDKMKLKWGKDAWREIQSEWQKIERRQKLLDDGFKKLAVEKRILEESAKSKQFD